MPLFTGLRKERRFFICALRVLYQREGASLPFGAMPNVPQTQIYMVTRMASASKTLHFPASQVICSYTFTMSSCVRTVSRSLISRTTPLHVRIGAPTVMILLFIPTTSGAGLGFLFEVKILQDLIHTLCRR